MANKERAEIFNELKKWSTTPNERQQMSMMS
jgi:hypothetical protein